MTHHKEQPFSWRVRSSTRGVARAHAEPATSLRAAADAGGGPFTGPWAAEAKAEGMWKVKRRRCPAEAAHRQVRSRG